MWSWIKDFSFQCLWQQQGLVQRSQRLCSTERALIATARAESLAQSAAWSWSDIHCLSKGCLMSDDQLQRRAEEGQPWLLPGKDFGRAGAGGDGG